jgi:NAD(P)-dependent dehydrogenase (short-subunit alcohol dehydrogenase family)
MARYDLDGKVALVTGAARGIGYVTARLLHERGASVAIVDRNAAPAEQAAATLSGRAIGIGADVSDRDAMTAAVAETVGQFGGLDVVVANAGIAPAAVTLRAVDADTFQQVIDVNLMGVWWTVSAALPPIVERKGHIVVIASVYAFVNGMAVGPDAVTKAGVEQLGRALRAELVQHGTTASVAYFGFVDTEMVQKGFEGDPLAKRLEDVIPRPLRKRIKPSVAAKAIVTGIERRAPRIVAPRRWNAVLYSRGFGGPFTDRYIESNGKIQGLLAEVDARVPQGIANPAAGD